MEILIILLVLGVVGFVVVRLVSDKTAKETQAAKRTEADAFLKNIVETKTLPEIAVSIVLKKGEKGIFQEQSKLLESRAYRVSTGAGTRIGKIYVGGARSESRQQLQEIDTGTLILTTQRLIFDGASENRSMNLSDLLSASAWQDAIEVSSTKRQKSQVYAVANPLIWASMIQNLATGSIAVNANS